MFALRFERDCCEAQTDGGSEDQSGYTMVSAKSFRVAEMLDNVRVYIPNEHGVEICHVVGNAPHNWSRCYVMNDTGATIDKIKVPDFAHSNVLPVRAADG